MDLFNKQLETGLIFDEKQDADPRNLRYEDFAPFGGQWVPSSGDVEKNAVTFNQNHTLSCTCQSFAGVFNQHTGVLVSPRYAYNKIKKDPKYPSYGAWGGAYFVDPFKLCANEGIADYVLAPNDATESDEAYLSLVVTPEMEMSALRRKSGAFMFVSTGKGPSENFDAVVRYLHEQQKPLGVGVDWYGVYNKARKGGVVPAVAPTGKRTGHAMMAVAWKSIGGVEYLGFRNSWGPAWGDKGRIWLPKGFTAVRSALAFVPTTAPTVTPMPVVAKEVRNIYLEQANALEMRRIIEEAFPENVPVDAKGKNAFARGLAFREWLAIVKAITYFGWTKTDVKNYLYARSRDKRDSKAYTFDFTRPKTT
jgi:hypothetical protein